jgi:predicted nucleotidyltransferase
MEIPVEVKWEEARMAIFLQLAQLREQNIRQEALLATTTDKLEGKFKKDLDDAHANIRALKREHKADIDAIKSEQASAKLKVAKLAGQVSLILFAALELIRLTLPALMKHLGK